MCSEPLDVSGPTFIYRLRIQLCLQCFKVVFALVLFEIVSL